MNPDLIVYSTLALATTLYAVVLERMNKRFEPDLTWLTVVIGVALIGGFVAWRLAWSVPALPPVDLAWWVWGRWFWAFVVGGLPIIVWQIWQAFGRYREAFRWYERKG